MTRVLGIVSKKSSYGLDGLDQRLIAKLRQKYGYYVELGANDGVAQSNTLVLELAYGWRGVLIEPVSQTFSQLMRNRNAHRNSLIRAACVPFGHPKETLQIALSNLMSTPIISSSDIPDVRAHVLGGTAPATQEIEYEEVEARTLTSLLCEAGAPPTIDLLSLDVEGGELGVLGGLDFTKFKFRWILVETRSPHEILTFLRTHNYELVEKVTHHDFLFRYLHS